ncbi:MAG: tRNA preQ1(34) S-adenosylmethionine ribosyltransferase-isomerase QueA [Deltaproteobacteria bacterium RBG_16_54_11]|nr:MAG: tRNA preQ1(34) S-adenosylmethionine ribosyltransferase-isomerase QueA [Deltaproteobacteria bacterium RBG_16_54_11]
MRIEDLTYHLPKGLIAQYPIEPRDKARLLVLKRRGGEMIHTIFSRLGDFLQKGDVLVVNDTRVMPARLCGHKETRGRVEVLLLRKVPGAGEQWECLVNRGKRVKAGTRLRFAPDLEGEVVGNGTDGKKRISFEAQEAFGAIIRRIGHVPLPPYIRGGADEPLDKEGYQTIFACHEGAIAAPTAGLHFTPELVRGLEQKGVSIVSLTLHVGLGSFQPIRPGEVEDHRLEPEFYQISPSSAEAINAARARGGRVCAVGTTVLRALETAVDEEGEIHPHEGMTELYICPGYRFKAIDALITNFHLPRSTLLLLVFAFAGRDLVMRAYQAAIREGYGFYSYGDGMLIM